MKLGPSGNEQKGNVTDPDNAKRASSRGVIQGYNGFAVVDDHAQIVVHAEAHGSGYEGHLLAAAGGHANDVRRSGAGQRCAEEGDRARERREPWEQAPEKAKLFTREDFWYARGREGSRSNTGRNDGPVERMRLKLDTEGHGRAIRWLET